MKYIGWHFLWIIALGYILGYYFPALGMATIGKIIPYQRTGG